MKRPNNTYGVPKYTIIDRDKGERFSTTDYESQDRAERERNRLALTYGKEFCLGVAEIDDKGNLHDLTEE